MIVSKTCTQEARRGRKKTDGAIVDRFFIVEKPVIQKLSSTQNKPEFLVKELANATQRQRDLKTHNCRDRNTRELVMECIFATTDVKYVLGPSEQVLVRGSFGLGTNW